MCVSEPPTRDKTMTTLITMMGSAINPIHEVRDQVKLEQLIASMENEGWTGRPVLAIGTMEYAQALTGSHRIEAAHRIGIDIPVLLIESGTDWTVDYSVDSEYDRMDLVHDLGDESARALLSAEGE